MNGLERAGPGRWVRHRPGGSIRQGDSGRRGVGELDAEDELIQRAGDDPFEAVGVRTRTMGEGVLDEGQFSGLERVGKDELGDEGADVVVVDLPAHRAVTRSDDHPALGGADVEAHEDPVGSRGERAKHDPGGEPRSAGRLSRPG